MSVEPPTADFRIVELLSGRVVALADRISVLENCIKEQHEINETMIATIEIILDTLRKEIK